MMIQTRRRSRYDVETLPLLTAEDFTYLGSFRVPSTTTARRRSRPSAKSAWCYVSDRGGLAFDPITGHLWAHDGYNVYEMTIPDLVASGDPLQLPIGSYVQPGFNPAEGHLHVDMGTTDCKLGGLMRFNDEIICAAYWYFDSAGAAERSPLPAFGERHNAELRRHGQGLERSEVSRLGQQIHGARAG